MLAGAANKEAEASSRSPPRFPALSPGITSREEFPDATRDRCGSMHLLRSVRGSLPRRGISGATIATLSTRKRTDCACTAGARSMPFRNSSSATKRSTARRRRPMAPDAAPRRPHSAIIRSVPDRHDFRQHPARACGSESSMALSRPASLMSRPRTMYSSSTAVKIFGCSAARSA